MREYNVSIINNLNFFMDTLILSKVEITAKKDGRKWVKLVGLSPKAEIIDVFFSLEEYNALGFPALENRFMSAEDVKALFDEYQAVKLAFDWNKRVVSVE